MVEIKVLNQLDKEGNIIDKVAMITRTKEVKSTENRSLTELLRLEQGLLKRQKEIDDEIMEMQEIIGACQ